jgi:hypothetical protein
VEALPGARLLRRKWASGRLLRGVCAARNFFAPKYGELKEMEIVPKKKRGGRRPGQTNLKTRALLLQKQATDAALAALLTPEQIKNVTSLECLRICMRVALQSGDFDRARIAASELAPYEYAKRSSELVNVAIPDDLLPDATPAPDEAGPENPVL